MEKKRSHYSLRSNQARQSSSSEEEQPPRKKRGEGPQESTATDVDEDAIMRDAPPHSKKDPEDTFSEQKLKFDGIFDESVKNYRIDRKYIPPPGNIFVQERSDELEGLVISGERARPIVWPSIAKYMLGILIVMKRSKEKSGQEASSQKAAPKHDIISVTYFLNVSPHVVIYGERWPGDDLPTQHLKCVPGTDSFYRTFVQERSHYDMRLGMKITIQDTWTNMNSFSIPQRCAYEDEVILTKMNLIDKVSEKVRKVIKRFRVMGDQVQATHSNDTSKRTTCVIELFPVSVRHIFKASDGYVCEDSDEDFDEEFDEDFSDCPREEFPDSFYDFYEDPDEDMEGLSDDNHIARAQQGEIRELSDPADPNLQSLRIDDGDYGNDDDGGYGNDDDRNYEQSSTRQRRSNRAPRPKRSTQQSTQSVNTADASAGKAAGITETTPSKCVLCPQNDACIASMIPSMKDHLWEEHADTHDVLPTKKDLKDQGFDFAQLEEDGRLLVRCPYRNCSGNKVCVPEIQAEKDAERKRRIEAGVRTRSLRRNGEDGVFYHPRKLKAHMATVHLIMKADLQKGELSADCIKWMRTKHPGFDESEMDISNIKQRIKALREYCQRIKLEGNVIYLDNDESPVEKTVRKTTIYCKVGDCNHNSKRELPKASDHFLREHCGVQGKEALLAKCPAEKCKTMKSDTFRNYIVHCSKFHHWDVSFDPTLSDELKRDKDRCGEDDIARCKKCKDGVPQEAIDRDHQMRKRYFETLKEYGWFEGKKHRWEARSAKVEE